MKSTIAVAVLLTMMACGKETVAPAPAATSPSATSPMVPVASAPVASAPLAPTAAAVAATTIPSQADESVAAAKEINKTNYKSALSEIEKELP